MDQKEKNIEEMNQRIEQAKDEIHLEQQKQVEIEHAAISERAAQVQQAAAEAKEKNEKLLQDLERKLKQEQKAKLTDILEKIQKKQQQFEKVLRDKEDKIAEMRHQEKLLEY